MTKNIFEMKYSQLKFNHTLAKKAENVIIKNNNKKKKKIVIVKLNMTAMAKRPVTVIVKNTQKLNMPS